MHSSEAAGAEIIWQAWCDGTTIDHLPESQRPRTRAAGYAIQAHLEAFSAHPRAGWKIAATSEAGQRHINVDGPLAGRLLAEKIAPDGAELSLTGNHMRVAEPEFAFRLAQPILARGAEYSVAEVFAAVGDLHPAIELPDSRFTDYTAVGAPALIADNAAARDLILGPVVTADWRGMDLAAHPVVCTVGGRYTREGLGSNVLGDPRKALTWCINELSQLGIDLNAGEVITTGTAAVPMDLEPSELVTADFGELGTTTVVLT
ncbi:MAG: fumarylacetoacetate hydrolase family protein [Pseudomonadota bacterium]